MSSRFSWMTPGIERSSLGFSRAVNKIENVLWKCGVGVCLDRGCMGFVITS